MFLNKLLLKIFGSRNERLIKTYSVIAAESAQFEGQLKDLSDDELKAKTNEFKDRIRDKIPPEQLLPEVFAVVREVALRKVNMRHFDVQLIGGNVLYEGKIAEMVTGEGKTLVATLAVYLVYLTGRKVHIVTVNDYLAKRDAEWMGPVYQALGMSVGAIQADMDSAGEDRKSQYQCDVTYGTNNEFGFDYLRDNMKVSLDQMAQGPLQYAIIDEVDSILIDEARTPLIISGPAFDEVGRYKKADQVARQLLSRQSRYDRIKRQNNSTQRQLANAEGELSEAKKQKDNSRIENAKKHIEKLRGQLEQTDEQLVSLVQYYEVEYDKKAVHLTHEGIGAAQEIAGVGSFFTGSNMEWPHLLEQSLRAHLVFEEEKDYVVMDGKVVIVDEFTGRLMHGRQWSDGLHQAVEAKQSVEIKEETQTLATITLQNFFKLYDQIAGMTGTAETEAGEFANIYNLEVIIIPTNEPCIREDRDDVIYKTMREKFEAIAEEIHDISANGRPVLVGTISIEKSEALSGLLSKKYGLEHEVLNAKHHEREAHIVTKAGQQHTRRDGSAHGNITIATNMAGRGTDIKLGPGVAEIGGLHILGSERHEARRIDNQLRGRTGRQGDAGSSQFFLSFDDDLMSVFAPEWTVKALSWIGWQEGQPIYHKRISKGIEKAQKKVEEKNFEIRKSLLDYDEVMDYQRKIFYSRRRQILAGENLKNTIFDMLESTVQKNCSAILNADYHLNCIVEWARTTFGVELRPQDIKSLELSEIEQIIKKQAGESAANDISLSLGEYLEDYEDSASWDISGLQKWAMSTFNASLSPAKIKHLSYDEIEQQLIKAAREQIEKKDCSQIEDFLRRDFAARTFINWAQAKFDIKLVLDELTDSSTDEVKKILMAKIADRYRQREIEYPVEFAMNMVYGPQGANIYAFETLAQWANKRFNAELSAEKIQNIKPNHLHKQLVEMSRAYNDGKLDEEINTSLSQMSPDDALRWANERFEASFEPAKTGEKENLPDMVRDAARNFLRRELAELEKYVLLQVYDSVWKEHLYGMDHLKESIWMRSLAQKDPKVEYKREGFRMFNQMLENVEDRVSDIIFKVHLEAGAKTRNVWNVSSTKHDEVGQFAMAEQQRAAAQAPQGERKVKQIKLKQPKVGRNDPCPCGSGKKYKKCCGAGK